MRNDPLARLVALLAKLPGIGEKSALRMALSIVRAEPDYGSALAEAVLAVRDGLRLCTVCCDLSASDVCERCDDPRRDRRTVCVVAQPQEFLAYAGSLLAFLKERFVSQRGKKSFDAPGEYSRLKGGW